MNAILSHPRTPVVAVITAAILLGVAIPELGALLFVAGIVVLVVRGQGKKVRVIYNSEQFEFTFRIPRNIEAEVGSVWFDHRGKSVILVGLGSRYRGHTRMLSGKIPEEGFARNIAEADAYGRAWWRAFRVAQECRNFEAADYYRQVAEFWYSQKDEMVLVA
jgi:hypothetical protein